jgi:hypothetical protein
VAVLLGFNDTNEMVLVGVKPLTPPGVDELEHLGLLLASR